MKIVAIVQARAGSVRLPNKVMRSILGVPMIEILLKRLNKSKLIDQIVLATSTDKKNKNLINHVEELGFFCFKGSEIDVLDRYVKAAEYVKAEIIVRIFHKVVAVQGKHLKLIHHQAQRDLFLVQHQFFQLLF